MLTSLHGIESAAFEKNPDGSVAWLTLTEGRGSALTLILRDSTQTMALIQAAVNAHAYMVAREDAARDRSAADPVAVAREALS